MALAFVASASGQSSGFGNYVSGDLNSTGADLLVAIMTFYAPGAPTLSDNKNFTWNPLNTYNDGGSISITMYWANTGGTYGSSHHLIVTGGLAYGSVGFLAMSGSNSSPYDQDTGNGTFNNLATFNPGPLTPSVANSLAVAGIGGAETVYNPPTGYTSFANIGNSGGVGYGIGGAYKILSGTPTENPTWTITVGNTACADLGMFKPASAAAAVTRFLTVLGAGA